MGLVLLLLEEPGWVDIPYCLPFSEKKERGSRGKGEQVELGGVEGGGWDESAKR